MNKESIMLKVNKKLIEKRLKQRQEFHDHKFMLRCLEAEVCPDCGNDLINCKSNKDYKEASIFLSRDYDKLDKVIYCNKCSFNHVIIGLHGFDSFDDFDDEYYEDDNYEDDY